MGKGDGAPFRELISKSSLNRKQIKQYFPGRYSWNWFPLGNSLNFLEVSARPPKFFVTKTGTSKLQGLCPDGFFQILMMVFPDLGFAGFGLRAFEGVGNEIFRGRR